MKCCNSSRTWEIRRHMHGAARNDGVWSLQFYNRSTAWRPGVSLYPTLPKPPHHGLPKVPHHLPPFMDCVKASLLLNGLRLLSRGGARFWVSPSGYLKCCPRSFDKSRFPLYGLLLSVFLPLACGLLCWNRLLVLRLLGRSLESFLSRELYESTDDTESRLRFFAESVNGLLEGGGDIDTLGDLRCCPGDVFPDPRLLELETLKSWRGDGDRDMMVEMLDTDADEADRILFGGAGLSKSSLCRSRFLPLSLSAFANNSSASPRLHILGQSRFGECRVDHTDFLISSCGTSLFNLGISFGFISCWVRDGRET